MLDADHDGEIGAAEIAGAPTVLLTLDRDSDGALSVEELHPRRPGPPDGAPRGRGPGPRGVDPVLRALDTDHDGALSAAEIAGAATSLAGLDANHDGKLTRDELRPVPPVE
jgi:Ca2+-binding EF-hand superfamily protein